MNLKNLNEEFKAHLYKDPSVENLDFDELASYLKEKTPISDIVVRSPLVRGFEGSVEDLAKEFAKIRVREPDTEKEDFEPLPGEVRFEEKLIRDPKSKITGILYDGLELDKIYRELLPDRETDLSQIHIIFTNRLFGTWDEGDHRYHARVGVYGFPSIISTTGIVEAPAKPKEFYKRKKKALSLGQTAADLEELKEDFEGEFVDYDDERLTEIMKGYVMQAIFHHIYADPFCDEKHCRLFNAHWQKEVLRAQLESPEFCEEHEKIISEWEGE